jgi:hypothetical protein
MRYYRNAMTKPTTPPKIDDVLFNREKFDAILRKIATAKPLQRKELLGSFPRPKPKP